METSRAGAIAISLMYEHGLRMWHFVWGKGGSWAVPGPNGWVAGRCLPDLRHIVLNWHLVQINQEKVVRDVILHEIAHALTPSHPSAHHDAQWKHVFKKIGGSGNTAPVMEVPGDSDRRETAA